MIRNKYFQNTPCSGCNGEKEVIISYKSIPSTCPTCLGVGVELNEDGKDIVALIKAVFGGRL